MNSVSFDSLTKTLSTPGTRRALVRGAVMGGIFGRLAAPSPASASQRTGVCGPTATGNVSARGNPSFAETFIAEVGGKLSRVDIIIDKAVGSTGDFVVKLHAVDPATGVPTDTVLAHKTVANSSVTEGDTVLLEARFKKRKTTKLLAGTTYAVVVSRPQGSGQEHDFAVRVATGDPCVNKRFFASAEGTGPFNETVSTDMLFEAFVGF
jgi:hypothetical protein